MPGRSASDTTMDGDHRRAVLSQAERPPSIQNRRGPSMYTLTKLLCTALTALILAASLPACMGGGGGSSSTSARPQPQPPAERARLAFPRQSGQHYQVTGLPAVRAADARQMPIYGDGTHLAVGVDQGAAVGSLPAVTTRGDTTIRHGRANDGAGAATLRQYLAATVDDPSLKYKTAPVVYFEQGVDGERSDFERAIRAVQLVNTVLPEDRKIRVASDGTSPGQGDGIIISFQNDPLANYWGVTNNSNRGTGNQITRSYIFINKAYTSNGDRQATILIAHELLHALGMFGGSGGGHVPPQIDSILEAGTAIYRVRQGSPQPLSLLYPADREAMRALYQRLGDGDAPTDFGPWLSTSMHVAGTGRHSAYGVAWRNGYAEPWAYGLKPTTTLSGSGSAVWNGSLVGWAHTGNSVTGNARVSVDLGPLTGRADFTGLEQWSGAPGAAGTGVRFGDGDLGYTIRVTGNTFRQTGGDAGRVTGVFVGRSHEGATGTLERTDLTAAFGAKR